MENGGKTQKKENSKSTWNPCGYPLSLPNLSVVQWGHGGTVQEAGRTRRGSLLSPVLPLAQPSGTGQTPPRDTPGPGFLGGPGFQARLFSTKDTSSRRAWILDSWHLLYSWLCQLLASFSSLQSQYRETQLPRGTCHFSACIYPCPEFYVWVLITSSWFILHLNVQSPSERC